MLVKTLMNYSDMTSPDLDLYDFTLMKETEVNGQKVWQIKTVPKTKDEQNIYTKCCHEFTYLFFCRRQS